MAIRYSGTIVDQAFNGATRSAVVAAIKNALVAAGWTAAGAGDDWKLTSEIPYVGAQMIARVYDGGGSNVYIRLSDVDEFLVQTNDFIVKPGVDLRIICGPYQVAIIGSPVNSAENVFFGIPYRPTFMTTLTRSIWGHGDAKDDTDATKRGSFRTTLDCMTGNGATGKGATFNLAGDTAWTGTNASSDVGAQRLIVPVGGRLSNVNGWRWFDDSCDFVEPLLAFAPAAHDGEAKIIGQLWDACVITDAVAADTPFTLDGHNWIVVTSDETGLAGTRARGALCLAIT